MNDTDILGQLRKERHDLKVIIDGASDRMNKLTAAIEALEGTSAPKLNQRKVPDLLGEAALRFGSDRVFDQDALVNMAISVFPTEDPAKIRRGMYSAVVSLVKKGRIVRAPGGFKLS